MHESWLARRSSNINVQQLAHFNRQILKGPVKLVYCTYVVALHSHQRKLKYSSNQHTQKLTRQSVRPYASLCRLPSAFAQRKWVTSSQFHRYVYVSLSRGLLIAPPCKKKKPAASMLTSLESPRHCTRDLPPRGVPTIYGNTAIWM